MDAVGEAKHCSVSQLQAFLQHVETFTATSIANWDNTVISNMGVVIGKLFYDIYIYLFICIDLFIKCFQKSFNVFN